MRIELLRDVYRRIRGGEIVELKNLDLTKEEHDFLWSHFTPRMQTLMKWQRRWEPKETLESLLEEYDEHFRMSDDPRTYKRGLYLERRIKELS